MIKKSRDFLLAFAIYGALALYIALSYPGRNNFNLARLWPAAPDIANAWLLTLYISLVSLALSFVAGLILYWITESKFGVLRYMGIIFDEVVFGSPLIVFVIAVYYFIAFPLGLRDRLWVGIFAFTLYMAPYMKTMVVGAMKAIDPTQFQAMRVLGFTPFQRFYYILLPQLLRIMFPPLIGNFSFIIKGSSLLAVIGIRELYGTIDRIQANLLLYVEGYFLMFVTYLLMTIPLMAISRWVERKISA
jgi:polar amino acid transport system permease protein